METLYRFDRGWKGGYGFYMKDGRVVFDYYMVFDADTNEWDSCSGSFSIDTFKHGIEELVSRGHAEIIGEGCILKINRDLSFSGQGYSNNVTILKFDIESLIKRSKELLF